jgi:hypothetical protein
MIDLWLALGNCAHNTLRVSLALILLLKHCLDLAFDYFFVVNVISLQLQMVQQMRFSLEVSSQVVLLDSVHLVGNVHLCRI